MSSDEICIFEPNLDDNGPNKFIILTEHDSIEDYNWIIDDFNPDLTYILYPSQLFSPYFRNYCQLLKAHSPDNNGLNSALYALTTNKYGFGFYNTLWRRCYAYLTETESILNACDNHKLYFNLSSQITSSPNVISGPLLNSSKIDKDGLFIRGVRDYVMKILFFDDDTELYDAHFKEYAQNDGEPIPKHQYFLQLWQSYKDRENEDDFWKYLVKWRDMIYWDYVIDSNAYLPHPIFTKILRKSYELYPPCKQLRHLPLNTSFKSLVHDTYNNLQQINIDNNGNINRVVLIVPTYAYCQQFCDLYGNTTDFDLIYASKYNEFDNFMHPRIKPIVYSSIGFGIGYYFKRQQNIYKHITFKRRTYRLLRYTANGTTATFLGIYALGASYFNLISSHSYSNQTVAKQIDTIKNSTSRQQQQPQTQTKRKWTDFLFRKLHNI